MESLSRPFRRKKLHSFSDYDGVFAAGAPGVSRFDDYNEIFGGSRCSIPVLDLSELDGAVDVAGSRGKAVNYSKIFGEGMSDDVVDSYEEVFSQRSPAKAASRSNGSASPGCQEEEEKLLGTPNRSVEGMKQYNTFYNRTSQGSKDGENGTTHVAHFRAVPGFTCFIDGNIKKTEGDEFRTLPRDKMRPTPKFSVELDTKQATDGAEKLKSQSSWDKLHSPDRNVDANGGSFKKQPFKLSSPTRVPAGTTSETKRSRELYFNIPKSGSSKTGPDDCSPSFSDDELDADSAAAVSAAALRKAVQEAEAIIRLAKEIMERRKNGLQKFPKPRSKGSLEMKKKNVEKASVQVIKTEKVAPNLKQIKEVRISNEGVRETNDAKSNSYDDGQAHIAKLESKKERRSGKLSPNIIQSVENCVPQNICGKGNEDRLETSVDLKTQGEIPEMLKTGDHKTATLELEHPKGSNFRLFVNNLFGKGNENKLKTCVDSKAPEQFPDLVTTENQRKEALEMGDTNGCNITSPVHNISGKGNEDMLEPSADLVKTENPRTANLELEHTNGNNVMPSVHRLCGEENEDKMEIFVDSKVVLGQFPGLVKTDNQRNITLQLGPTNDSNIMTSVHSFSENENEEKLEIFSDSKELPELVKPDNQKTEDFKALGQFPELVNTDDQKTEILDEEQKIASNSSPPVQNVLREENEEKVEPSDDARAPEQSTELVKTDNQRTATLELGHKYGSVIVPPVERTNDCGEMEKQTDERTLELLERHSKEVHRKRKQWKDFEGIPSEIKIAEDGGQSLRSTTAGEVHEQEEGNSELLEGNTKEIFRKRKQWKDVEVKPYDIKIVGDGEKCIHGQERRDKATDVPHNKGVEDKPTTSCSEESYEKEVVNSQELEKIEGFEPLNVNTNHGEESDEAQKWVENEKIKECSKEAEIANSSMDVHEEKESVILMCKQDIIEKKFQESSKWKDYEVTFEVESNESGQNDDNRTTDAWKEDGSEHLGDCQVAHKYEEDDNHISFEGSETMSDASQSSIDFKEDFSFDEEEVGEASEVFQSCEFNMFEIGFKSERTYVQGQTQTSMTNQAVEDVTITEATESLLFNGIPENAVSSDGDSGAKQTYFDGINSELANNKSAGIEVSDQMQEKTNVFDLKIEMARRIEASQLPIIFKGEEITKGLYEQEWFTMRNRKEGQPPYISKNEEKTRGIDEVEEKTAKENREKEVRAEKEQLERNDDLSKREREREQNRVVVERAIREARERAFAEARERAERAAVEKATAEARERVMAEARQKFEKRNTATKSSTEKASLQAKLRSERAAVERAHAEARERALEKALSQKSIFPSSKLDGNNGESVERRNARLEKTQKTMERAAKALAEKNMRDLRAQREQAERHRLAETLDAEIKRWSSGKTGNLRALLSTLQYILGPDSGWQSVSLTEIVTTNAVKKAYRKATLHVHPDKLQQRGATIQQKYICEKVFDLLKAAWNRFNSEER